MLKGMSVIGGAQALQTVMQIGRAKCAALLLGPAGVGVSSLLASSAAMIQQTAAVGLPAAVARDMSLACGDSCGEGMLASVSRRLSVCLGAMAAMACCALAIPLSAVTLGSSQWAWQYIFVALAICFGVMSDTERSLLQGMRCNKSLARVTCGCSALALATCVPLYWLWGVGGISPSMLAASLFSWALYRWETRRIAAVEKMPWRRFLAEAKPLLAFGGAIMGAQMLGALSLYLQNVFIRVHGDAADVGMWQSSASICAQGAALVFAAMAMDYYPRLTRMMAEGQGEIAMRRQTRVVAMVTAPLSMLLMLCAPLVVRVLLSSEFEAAVPLLRLFGVSLFFQAISYPGGYVVMAAGSKRLYFWMEGVGFNILMLAMVCGGYLVHGLTGIGVAYISLHAISMIVYAVVNKRLYGISYSGNDAAMLAALIAAVIAVCGLSFGGATALALGALLALATAIFCGRHLINLWRQ